MTSKRNLEKCLERLEAQREMKRTAQESVSGEVDEAVVDAVIAFATHRLRGCLIHYQRTSLRRFRLVSWSSMKPSTATEGTTA